MKKSLGFLLLSIGFVSNVFAQDQIILKSAEEIKGKVTEIKIDRIVYKDYENLEGPTIELRKSDVFIIIYENGKVFKIEDTATAENKSSSGYGSDVQSRELDDNRHHIVSFFANLPEFRTSQGTDLIGVGLGLSYELQSRSKIFGLKFSPEFSMIDFDYDIWSFTFCISPRWYLVNRRPGQFGLGLEGGIGTFFKPEGRPSSYESLIVSAHMVMVTHLFTTSKFNANIELGLGYQYWKEQYTLTNYYYSQETIAEANLFSLFLRMSLGARLGSK